MPTRTISSHCLGELQVQSYKALLNSIFVFGNVIHHVPFNVHTMDRSTVFLLSSTSHFRTRMLCRMSSVLDVPHAEGLDPPIKVLG